MRFTLSAVSPEIEVHPFNTFETVETDTPALAATSLIVYGILLLLKLVIMLNGQQLSATTAILLKEPNTV